MLNKREMSLAQELARELVEINQPKEKDRFQMAFEAVGAIVESVKESFVETWDAIQELMGINEETLERIEYEESLRESWQIPIKINPPPLPDIPLPRMMNIRSDL